MALSVVINWRKMDEQNRVQCRQLMGVPSLRFDSTETIETYRDYPSIALSHLVSVNLRRGSFLVHVGGEASTQTRFARAAHPGFGSLCSLPRSSHSYSCSSSQQSSRSGSAFSALPSAFCGLPYLGGDLSRDDRAVGMLSIAIAR